jgi:cellulose synthase/poly-beta-1,6-N-acetylglucosamine synthase-like glycosyltransferase
VWADVLAKVGAFQVPAPVGTDYTLARQLKRGGYAIWWVPFSAVETSYPDDWRSSARQRSRWLRNLIVIGLQTGDYATAWQGLRSGLVGSGLLLLPALALVLGPAVWALWITLLAQGALARLRYTAALGRYRGAASPGAAAASVLSLGVDLWTWTAALVQSLVPSWRERW